MTTAVQQPLFTNLDQDYHLSKDEVKTFAKNGYLGPFSVCTPEEFAPIRERLEKEIFDPSTCSRKDWGHNRHLDSRLMWELSTHPAISQRMASIYGPNLLMWRTNFFIKPEGGLEIPWHQDYNYWPLEPAIIISAWMAIDDCTIENSAVQIIPGSHRRILPHTKVTADMKMAFGEMAEPERVEPMKKDLINMEMKAGQFFLFNERTLHHSEPNRSTLRRAGLAIRVIVPIVNVLGFDSPDHKLMQICGEDPMGLNPIMPPPGA